VELQRPALEHGTTRSGRWLRSRRLRIALLLAVLEGVLVVFDVIPGWLAFLVAVAVIALYFFVGRDLRPDGARQVAWIAAFSQACVALVPALVILAGMMTLLVLGAVAVLVIIALFADRR
jgi:hypothetical protein